MPGPEAPAELSQPAVDRMVADALAAFAAALRTRYPAHAAILEQAG